MMTPQQLDGVALGGVIVAFITGAVAIAVALIARSSNQETARNSAGELALKLAQESKRELAEIKVWQSKVRVAWREHEDYDETILDRLEALAPGTRASLPPRPSMPID